MFSGSERGGIVTGHSHRNKVKLGERTMVVRVQRMKGRLETLTHLPDDSCGGLSNQCRARGRSPDSCTSCWTSSVDDSVLTLARFGLDSCTFTVPPRSRGGVIPGKSRKLLALSMFLQSSETAMALPAVGCSSSDSLHESEHFLLIDGRKGRVSN